MRINKKVEAVAEMLYMINPDFNLSERYTAAYQIVKALEEMPEDLECEPS
jgi:hypothetical protein